MKSAKQFWSDHCVYDWWSVLTLWRTAPKRTCCLYCAILMKAILCFWSSMRYIHSEEKIWGNHPQDEIIKGKQTYHSSERSINISLFFTKKIELPPKKKCRRRDSHTIIFREQGNMLKRKTFILWMRSLHVDLVKRRVNQRKFYLVIVT